MKNFLQHFILLVAISIFGLAIYQNGLQTNADWQCGENGLWNGSTCDCDPGYSRPGEGYECELDYIPTYYGIDLYADPSTGGVIDGYGRYEEGQEASISAIPNTGYIFSGWRRYGDNSRVLYNPYVFDMWNDEEFTAYFTYVGEEEGTDRAAIYTAIDTALEAEGIETTFDQVTNENATGFENLYIAKYRENGGGSITFQEPLDLTSTDIQDFLQPCIDCGYFLCRRSGI